MMRVGLVGCGNIGGIMCRAIADPGFPAEIVAVTDAVAETAERFVQQHQLNAAVLDLDSCVAASDFVVECATGTAVPALLRAAIDAKRDCLIMSVGGLIASDEAYALFAHAPIAVRVPSGALCGLDGVRAAREAGLDRVALTTRKPPKGLAGAPHIVEQQIDLEAITEPTVVFDGTARDAVRAFPANVNVAAALSLAGLGPERTTVRVVADPGATRNAHEIEVEGPFGRLRSVTENVPSPDNPKSSYLAALSAIAELREAASRFAGSM